MKRVIPGRLVTYTVTPTIKNSQYATLPFHLLHYLPLPHLPKLSLPDASKPKLLLFFWQKSVLRSYPVCLGDDLLHLTQPRAGRPLIVISVHPQQQQFVSDHTSFDFFVFCQLGCLATR